MSGMDWDRERLARMIKEAREALRWLQTDLAREARVGRSTIQRLEGEEPLRRLPTTAPQIEAALGWGPGSFKAILEGGEPALLTATVSTVHRASAVLALTDSAIDRLPPHIAYKLRDSELYDTDAYDLTEDGGISMLTIVVRPKGEPPQDAAQLRREMRAWEQARRRLHGRPPLPWEPGDPEDPPTGATPEV